MQTRFIKTALFLFSLIGTKPLFAQDYSIPKLQTSFGYFGEFITHPGVKLGMSYTIKQKNKNRKSGKQITKGWLTGVNITFYHHKFNHKALMLTGSIGRQRIGNAGFLTQLNFETGYMASFLDGEVYEWNGNTFEKGKKGSSHTIFGFNGLY